MSHSVLPFCQLHTPNIPLPTLNMIPTRYRNWASSQYKCLMGRYSYRHLSLCSSPFCSPGKSLFLNLPLLTQVAWSNQVWSEPDAHHLLPLNLLLSTWSVQRRLEGYCDLRPMTCYLNNLKVSKRQLPLAGNLAYIWHNVYND